MANVLLTWTAPTVTTNVDGIVIARIADDGSSTQPSCDAFIAANQLRNNTAADLVSGGSVVQVGSDITDLAVTQAVDQGVPVGNYWYAAFSYNSAGYSPCDVNDTLVSVTA